MSINEKTLFFSIGESSGDRLAAEILHEFQILESKTGNKTRIFGITGPATLAQGLEPVRTLDDVEGAGLVELLPELHRLTKNLLDLRGFLGRNLPNAALMVDAPELQRLLLPILRRRRIPAVCVAPPQVWAWRKNRIRSLQRYEKVFSLFEFETRFLRNHGLPAEFVGHPLAYRPPLIRELENDESRWNVLLFPGSRTHEISRNLAWYTEAAKILRKQAERPVAFTVVVAENKRKLVEKWVDQETFTLLDRDELDARTIHADLAWCKPGTNALEIALSGLPMVVAHRAHPISEAIVRQLATASHFALPNLILGRRETPELLGPAATSERLSRVSLDILRDARYRWKCREQAKTLRDALTAPGQPPARKIASYLMTLLYDFEDSYDM